MVVCVLSISCCVDGRISGQCEVLTWDMAIKMISDAVRGKHYELDISTILCMLRNRAVDS